MTKYQNNHLSFRVYIKTMVTYEMSNKVLSTTMEEAHGYNEMYGNSVFTDTYLQWQIVVDQKTDVILIGTEQYRSVGVFLTA